MRCRLAKYLRSKIAVSIIITAVFGLVIKEALFPVRAFLLNSHFTEQKKPLRKYGDSQNALPSPSPESHKKAVFIPASFLNSEVPKNESYCNFNYKFPDVWNMTELFLEATPQLGNNGPYRVVYNLIEGRFEDNTVGVTYCTHATLEFLYHIAEIVNRWDGPVSVAVFAPGTDLFPFLIVHREYPYHRWEPIYIGTNSEPLYSEILTWEGQQDKMTQMAEMCLMQYNFVILDGAFLVHTPGVKHRKDISPNQTLWRRPYEWENMKRYRNIAQTLLQKYTSRRSCKI
ncbi:uncharacterized protein LOC124605273 isoform X2 [Schistocerca americana]|uniref:uncharacterized protein LOC124605273 isoform X2 n=1 Tax=Schistocerca americana TaxID=7009 RepID=UPI001F4FE53C|nr:uncharacterized protein LOC124605273 isoform X2 [Schistocerca americana]